MLQGIGNRIALQFTGLIFLLLVLNGILFLAADFGNARRISQDRLMRMSQVAMNPSEIALMKQQIPTLPPHLRERVRIITSEGKSLFSGAMFNEEIPTSMSAGYMVFSKDEDQFGLLTVPIMVQGSPKGFVQIVNPERAELHTLPLRAGVYLFLSALISCIIYAIARVFTNRSLKPAEETMMRLEQFTQDASHELRTPLAALNSSLDLALKTKKYEEGIRSAKDDVKELTVLIERLLELTRLDSISMEKQDVNLSSLVSDTVNRHVLLAKEKQITLASTLDDNIIVQGDPALIRQILANLLSNALKFTDAGGTVTVTLNSSSLTVHDTGIGIPAKEVAHIFDRFYQVDQSRTNDGYGLGLALVKRITDLHGWVIHIQSKPKKGTSVIIRFTAMGRAKSS
jgi:signal transduction histidine kinase